MCIFAFCWKNPGDETGVLQGIGPGLTLIQTVRTDDGYLVRYEGTFSLQRPVRNHPDLVADDESYPH